MSNHCPQTSLVLKSTDNSGKCQHAGSSILTLTQVILSTSINTTMYMYRTRVIIIIFKVDASILYLLWHQECACQDVVFHLPLKGSSPSTRHLCKSSLEGMMLLPCRKSWLLPAV